MLAFAQTFAASLVMGLSIYLSYPLLTSSKRNKLVAEVLSPFAVGILVFLIGDVFADASQIMYNGSLYGYGSSPMYDFAFAAALVASFLVVLAIHGLRGGGGAQSQYSLRLPLIVALGVGFQNLTEGLVFGSLGEAIGLTGVAAVVLLGFTLQNMTEGFPIAVAYNQTGSKKAGRLAALLLLGGGPTVAGAVVGYFEASELLAVVFDGLAVGSILYVVLPMLRSSFKEADARSQGVVYASILAGFVAGLAVNLI